MPQGARLSLKRYFEILMPGLVPGISVFGKVVPVPVVNGVLRACWFVVLACLVVTPASAQDAVADFFRGKQITIYVGSSAGGGYDTYARLIARYFGNHMPGNPTVVVENMPGAGSNKATGYIYSVAPKDGTAMAAVFPGALLDPLIGDVNVQHDPNKLIYVGNANRDVYICFLRSDAPAKT